MANYFKKINISEEIKNTKILFIFLQIITLILIVFERSISGTLASFGTILEVALSFAIFNAFLNSMKNRNYAYWGISFVLFLFLLKNFIFFSFVTFNLSVLYIVFLGFVLLAINSYVMSSPLYFPRVQWWEYDYKYRADKKIKIKIADQEFEGRLTDLRRSEASIECFEYIKLETEGSMNIHFSQAEFDINFKVKTEKELIKGRPIRYGIQFNADSESLSELKKYWKNNKQVKLRNKFKNES
ncbi:MAG: hypothetical protein N4A33_09325 [Bacteriovoracaceae bacterium]|jgi:hypothetical protein|nr:hypothetical protein [Bacteriovoracaceae bacterium]